MALDGRVAVISGATGEAGRAAARALAGKGVRLALLGTSMPRLDQMASELALPDGQVTAFAGDMRNAGIVRAAEQAVTALFGRIDILLNLVGGWTGGRTLANADPNDLQQMIDQHVWTTFHMAQIFGPRLVENGWGRIMVISSPSAVRPQARGGLYAAAKAAQEALIMTLAQEMKGTGVTANVLQVRTIDEKHERQNAPSPANANWTIPEEIGAAVLYLCSEEGGAVNGARIPLYREP